MKNHPLPIINLFLIAAFGLSACAAPATPLVSTIDPAEVAQVSAEETALAGTVAAVHATATSSPTLPPPTLTPTETGTPTPLPPTATSTPLPTPSYEEFAAGARILLYEDLDLFKHANEMRFAINALDNLGLSYVNTKTHPGDLLHALQKESWDLVIIASENKSAVIGEFIGEINTYVYGGGALIWEAWYFDDIKNLSFNYTLQSCGLDIQGEYKDSIRSVFWVKPEHPLLNHPNSGFDIEGFRGFWTGDVGDLLTKRPDGNGEAIGSTNGSDSQNVVLANCLDGRVIVQTFSSHDHKNEDMLPLWENYIVNALQARYRAVQAGQFAALDDLRTAAARLKVMVQGVWYANSPSTVLSAARFTHGSGNGNANMSTLITEHEPDVVFLSLAASDTQQPKMLDQAKDMLDTGKVVVIRGQGDPQAWRNMAPILEGCGLEPIGLQNIAPDSPGPWLAPEHPFFHAPAPLAPLTPKANNEVLAYLLRKLPGSQAEALGGVEVNGETGLYLTTCYDGRLVLLTMTGAGYSAWENFQLYEHLVWYALEKALGRH